MSLLFVWRPSERAAAGAAARFDGVLEKVRSSFETGLGRPFSSRTAEAAGVRIGSIATESGVQGWSPWWQAADVGIAWSGVCEELLGRSVDAAAIADVQGCLTHESETVVGWHGRFAACCWGPGRVGIVTGATESPTLWETDGPDGWALGSRAGPLVDLVDGKRTLDLDAAARMVVFGYLAGGANLLAGVRRVAAGRRLTIGADGPVRREVWAPVSAVLAPALARPGDLPTPRSEAERLATRVARQLGSSDDAAILLTGGRDSRSIAAAAVKAGFVGPTITGGPAATADRRVAAAVAGHLGLPNQAGRHAEESLMVGVDIDSASAWIELDGGAASLRQGVAHRRFFRGERPVSPGIGPLFHGLGGEILRGYYYGHGLPGGDGKAAATSALREKTPLGLRLRHPVEGVLQGVIDEAATELGDLPLSGDRWLDLFYWRDRCLSWGEDMMSMNDQLQWHWAPLLDRDALLAAWRLPVEQKRTGAFVEALTLELAPGLGDVPYAGASSGVRHRTDEALRSAARRLGSLDPRLSHALLRRRAPVRVDASLLSLWEAVFRGPGDHVWPELIDRRELDGYLARQPGSDVLWSLATVELFARASLG